jgi:putative methyltransferase (TIGR04325 family)
MSMLNQHGNSVTRISGFKSLARDWTPPALRRWANQLRESGNDSVQFEDRFTTWVDASVHCSGYEAEDILAKVLKATIKVKRSEAAYERDSVLFDEIEYTWPLLSGLMWAAARNGGKLNVLDFGGALGSSYFQNRHMLETLPEVSWNVVEQPHYVDAGREFIQDVRLRFYESIEECLVENKPNVILLSSVLQYLRFPETILKQLSFTNASTLIIDRTPFSNYEGDKILVQHVPDSIYNASYPMWVFSKVEFVKKVACEWSLVAQTLSPEGNICLENGFEFSFQGLLLESKK